MPDHSRRLDELLLTLLAATSPLVPAQLEEWRTSWHASRSINEGLVDYLVRRKIFHQAAPRLLVLLSQQFLQAANARCLFSNDGWRKACDLAQRWREGFVKQSSGGGWRSLYSSRSWQQLQRSTAEMASMETQELPELAIWQGMEGDPLRLAPARPNGPPQVGVVLGKCLLTDLLGKGGSGTVFRALHHGLNIPVAVKVLNRKSAENTIEYERLKSEAQLLAKLSHPSILRVLDFEDDPDYPFVVLECIEGSSLAERIEQSGRLPWASALTIVTSVAEGLTALWEMGIVHRDVKPGNILLGRNGSVKLADLGLAMTLRSDADPSSMPGLVGTAAYMAPEQAQHAQRIHRSADVYALGCTFFHAVTGRLPFEASSVFRMLLRHAGDPPTPARHLVPDLPESISQLILEMMAKRPEDRPSEPARLLDALHRCATI